MPPWGPGAPCWEWPSLAAAAGDLRDDYDERAGIVEFDGQMTREQAEGAAYGAIYKRALELANTPTKDPP